MALSNIPRPLTEGHLCQDCKGTGANIAKTLKLSKHDGYIQCWTCNGRGIDPAEYFRWSEPNTPPSVSPQDED